MTKYGQMILDIINQSLDHLTAEQIFFMCKEKNEKIVLATVYNNLSNLCNFSLFFSFFRWRVGVPILVANVEHFNEFVIGVLFCSTR